MVIFNVIMGVTLIGLLMASINDVRTREVPDWLNYALICVGLGLRLLYSVVTFDFGFLLSGVLGFIVFLGLAYVMFYAGQWGGGDSKLLMGMGALIGLEFSMDSMILSFIINLALVGAVYGFIWSIILAVKGRKQFAKAYTKLLQSSPISTIRIIVIVLTIVFLFMVVVIKDPSLKFLIFSGVLMTYFTFYLWIFVKAVEGACMLKMINTSKLTEGDWIAKNVMVKGKYICGPKDLGIERKQIKLLKKLKIKKVLVKEGIPFVPSFLFAFIISILGANWWQSFI